MGAITTTAAGVSPALEPSVASARLPLASLSFEGAFLPGTLLGPGNRYRIDRLLGKGGFSATYLAYDTQLERACVVKQLVVDPTWDDGIFQAARQGFRREVELLSTLNSPGHPHIPEIYEGLEERSCLVMKYIEGANLRMVLQQHGGPLPLVEALGYARAICSALIYMHSRQPQPVLHRDIKPENIVLGSDGRVWLIDFGLAKAIVEQAAPSSNSLIAGTPGYTPVEQWRGVAEPRSDVYALAATLYTLLTGWAPPVGSGDPPEPLQQRNRAIMPAVEVLIARGMAEDVASRPTAQAFLAALEALLISPPPLVHGFQASDGTPLADDQALVAWYEQQQQHVETLLSPLPFVHGFQAPDGTLLGDDQALTAWCEQHWQQAAVWLYSCLPDQVPAGWGNTKLVDDLRRCVRSHPSDPDAGLDMALALLDPQGFAAAVPTLDVDKAVLDFDTRCAPSVDVRPLTLTNTSRRYVRAHVARPSWVSTTQPTVALIPGQCSTMILRVNLRRPRFRGWIGGPIQVRQHGRTLVQIPVQVVCLSWLHYVWRIASASFL